MGPHLQDQMGRGATATTLLHTINDIEADGRRRPFSIFILFT